MALAVTARGSGSNNASANPLNASPSGNFAAGSSGVLAVTADNASSGGSTNDFPATITDSLGNTWTRRQAPIFDNGAASAGIQGAIYTSDCSAGAPQTSTTIPITTGVVAVAKGWSLYEITKAANAEVAYVTGGVSTGATTGTPTVNTTSIPVGDVVVGAYHAEGVAATTGDADATNGSWSAQVTVTVGATTSGIRHSTQTKVQTTTASTQTFNPTATSQDCILSWVQLHEQHTANAPALAMTGGGVVTRGATKGAQLGLSSTGGGVATLGRSTARNVGLSATGGGVVTRGLAKGGQGAAAITGGGAVALAGSKGGQTGVALTGGGVVTWDAVASSSESHSGSFTATGGGSAAIALQTQRSVGVGVTGGGVATPGVTTSRSTSIALTGGGVGTFGATKAASIGITATGGGAVTIGGSSTRSGAFVGTGGGVFSLVARGGRQGGFAITGGGVVVATGSSAEDHAGGFHATGGGVVVAISTSGRVRGISATGGGAVALDARHDGLVGLSITGAGSVEIGADAPRLGSFVVTGGGVVTIDGGIPPTGFPDVVEVSIAVVGGVTGTAVRMVDSGSGTIEPITTTRGEVRIE